MDPLGRRPYFDCKCLLRTTFETQNGLLMFGSRDFNISYFQNQGLMIAFERQGNDYTDPGKAAIVIDGTTYSQNLAVIIYAEPGEK